MYIPICKNMVNKFYLNPPIFKRTKILDYVTNFGAKMGPNKLIIEQICKSVE